MFLEKSGFKCDFDTADKSNRESLGGNGHTFEACMNRCLESENCNYAARTNSGFCHLTQTCNGEQSAGSWTLYRKQCSATSSTPEATDSSDLETTDIPESTHDASTEPESTKVSTEIVSTTESTTSTQSSDDESNFF